MRRLAIPVIDLLIREYDLVLAGLASVILATSAIGTATVETLISLVVYLTYALGRRVLDAQLGIRVGPPAVRLETPGKRLQGDVQLSPFLERVRGVRLSFALAIVRTLAALVAVTTFSVRVHQVGGSTGFGVDSLWLLFVIALHPAAEHRRTRLRHFIPLLLLACGCLAITQLNVLPIGSIFVRVLWVVFLAITYYLLIHAIGVWWEGIQLLERFSGLEPERPPIAGPHPLLQRVVEGVQKAFDYPTVLVIVPGAGSQAADLRPVAAAGRYADGLLSSERLTYDVGFDATHPQRDGVLTHVLRTGEWYVANDAITDRYFRAVVQLPDTACELAVPIDIDRQVVAVLAVEQRYDRAFTRRDQAILQIVAGYLGPLLAAAEGAYAGQLGARVVGKLLDDHQELPSVFAEIAAIAVDAYVASGAIVYGYYARTHLLAGPFAAGIDKVQDMNLPVTGPIESDTLLDRIIRARGSSFFHSQMSVSTEADPLLAGCRGWDGGVPGAASRAILRLHSGKGECLGVAFLYFSSRLWFHEPEATRFLDFAKVAGAACARVRDRQVASQSRISRALDAVATVVTPRAQILNLSKRESEVARHAALGKSNSEIAEILVISPKTVGNHLQSCYQKLNIRDGAVQARVKLAATVLEHDRRPIAAE